MTTHRYGAARALVFAAAAGLAGCAFDPTPRSPLPAARGATLAACAELERALSYPRASFSAAPVGAGELSVAGKPIAAHCRVTGHLNERSGPVDGKRYAIGFEMRLPAAWNGRFFYQANGGVDGTVVAA
ncbi:MAG: tannase/feruloyl esterase family alpha/beta hydrolase, partial [Pseudomonadota bacterium]|nr:tannase/feruloyl esterase family alpha/beta hydrolase [Pseudomonadota bacterium]